jgi:hypothetical protein
MRVRAQGLEPRRPPDVSVEDVVAGAAGLQAQQWSAAVLSVRARSATLRAADVERAHTDDRTVVRGWFMRGTLHLVPTADFRWLLDLYAPVTIAGSERRYRQLGLDEGTRERGASAIRAAVADHGPLPRRELVSELLRRGVGIDPDSQAVPHLIAYACLSGVICHGPHRDGEPAFALLDDWLPALPTLDGDQAVDELARRYLAAFGPSGLDDFATWSGLPMSRSRAAWRRIGGELTEVRAAGSAAWMLTRDLGALDELAGGSEGASGERLRLLPAFDTYLLGYRSRELAVDAEHARAVWPGGGILRPAVVADGRAVALWRYDASRKTPVVRVSPFTEVTPALRAQLQAEAEDVGRFLETTLTLEVE